MCTCSGEGNGGKRVSPKRRGSRRTDLMSDNPDERNCCPVNVPFLPPTSFCAVKSAGTSSPLCRFPLIGRRVATCWQENHGGMARTIRKGACSQTHERTRPSYVMKVLTILLRYFRKSSKKTTERPRLQNTRTRRSKGLTPTVCPLETNSPRRKKIGSAGAGASRYLA